MKTVLHVGCGRHHPDKLYKEFRGADWREVRLDIDPAVAPDIVASMTDLGPVADASHDAIYSSHTLEHLYWHQVPVALAELRRVLKPGGTLLLRLPDLGKVCAAVAAGTPLTEPLYVSQAGPITAMDVMFGYVKWVAEGNEFMAHRCGFTRPTLRKVLDEAGFAPVNVAPDRHWNLWARALKPVSARPAGRP